MNDLEERLRAVTRAAAEQITPDRIPPPPVLAPGLLRRAVPGRIRLTAGHTGRWQARLAPLAAAVAVVAVVAVVAGSLSFARAIGGHSAGRDGAASAAAAAAGLPPYYVALAYSPTLGYAQPGRVMVRSTATGAVLPHVTPPRGEEFVSVSGAADDRTFVLAAETQAQAAHRIRHASRTRGLAAAALPERFYLLRVDAATRTTRLTPLPVPELPDVTQYSLSPDGTELAVFSATREVVTASVYSVASGSARTWTEPTHQDGQYKWLASWVTSWVQGGKLAFMLAPAHGTSNGVFGLLNTAAPGGNLLSSSRMFPPGPCSMIAVTQNGKLVIGSVPSGGGDLPWRLQVCAITPSGLRVVTSGQTLRCQNGSIASLNALLWVSPTGNRFVTGVSCSTKMTGATGAMTQAGVIKPLSGSSSTPYMTVFPGKSASW